MADGAVLVVGDLHQNLGAALEVIDYASTSADLILICGDFGYWPRHPAGIDYLRTVQNHLARHGLQLWWVDGEHDDLVALARIRAAADGRRQLSSNIWHLPRGFRWTWHGVDWLAVGGGISMDSSGRPYGKPWPAREELGEAEVANVLSAGPAQVLLTHMAPLGVRHIRRQLGQHLPPWRRTGPWPTGRMVRSDEQQRRIRRLLDGVGASRLIHGHHNLHYQETLDTQHGEVLVTGLADDTAPIGERCLLVNPAGYQAS